MTTWSETFRSGFEVEKVTVNELKAMLLFGETLVLCILHDI